MNCLDELFGKERQNENREKLKRAYKSLNK